MKKLLSILFLVAICASACQRKVVSNEVPETSEIATVNSAPNDKKKPVEEEMGMMEGPTNTLIKARIVKVIEPKVVDGSDSPCALNPCQAMAVLEDIVGFGSSFHGQYEVDDTLLLSFDFTTRPTRDIFPELTKHLPGLSVGDHFKAELLERPDVDIYRVQMYTLTDNR